MWVRNQDRDVLINLNTGLRLVIMPGSKKDEAEQLYGVIVQAPAEATQPLVRSLLTGFSNTELLSGAPYINCLQLLELIWIALDGWQVPELPYDEDRPETCILEYTDSHKTTHRYICEDETTAMYLIHRHVTEYWPKHLGEIPQDEGAAIKAYYECFSSQSWRIIPAPYVNRIAEKGKGK